MTFKSEEEQSQYHQVAFYVESNAKLSFQDGKWMASISLTKAVSASSASADKALLALGEKVWNSKEDKEFVLNKEKK